MTLVCVRVCVCSFVHLQDRLYDTVLEETQRQAQLKADIDKRSQAGAVIVRVLSEIVE